ncbi:hypothetical protein [Vibrio scophthalmi]|uniref:hypothetical protein n=1 Tax=Vibrio scophthalmi TaxID=45658 RepID=UPI0012EAB048|nr:hypothetical protein [Vibrio scophthalmi]
MTTAVLSSEGVPYLVHMLVIYNSNLRKYKLLSTEGGEDFSFEFNGYVRSDLLINDD